VADEAAHLRSVAELVSALSRDPHDANLLAQRNDLVRAAGRHIQRMQKALTQMNIQLANVLSDVSGMTGQAIVQAILAGERHPYQLAALRNWRGKASQEEIARSLEGNWQEEHLFVLQQEQDGYQFCLKQMAECDQRLQQYLQLQRTEATEPVCRKKSGRNGSGRKRRGIRHSSTCAQNSSHDWNRSHPNRRD